MWEHFEFIVNKVIEHWPLIAAASLFWTLGNVIKSVVPAHDTHQGWSWAWRLLPFYPVLMGMSVGCLPWAPLPESAKVLGGIAPFLYYSLAGVLATYIRDIVQTFKKYKIVVPKD